MRVALQSIGSKHKLLVRLTSARYMRDPLSAITPRLRLPVRLTLESEDLVLTHRPARPGLIFIAARLFVCVAALIADWSLAAAEEPIRGVVRAVNYAALSTDIPMRLIRLPFREGQAFRGGEIIAEFDCRRSEAERHVVNGTVREAQSNLEANLKLDGYRAIGRHEIEVSRARLDKAKGEQAIIEARLEDCIIRAPFAGRVAEAPVRLWEFTAAQRPYLSIVEEENFEIDLILPSKMLVRALVGQQLEFRVDEIPKEIGKAIISAIGPTVDPVSKTGRITAKVTSAPASLAVGMSCTAQMMVDQR